MVNFSGVNRTNRMHITRSRVYRGAEHISGGVLGTPNIGTVRATIWSTMPICVHV